MRGGRAVDVEIRTSCTTSLNLQAPRTTRSEPAVRAWCASLATWRSDRILPLDPPPDADPNSAKVVAPVDRAGPVDFTPRRVDEGYVPTANCARALGVTNILRHSRMMGLARSFRDGVEYALAHGADIVVNTDGDNQYPPEPDPRPGRFHHPGQAEIVIADRRTRNIADFSRFKKSMQMVGSGVGNRAAGTRLPDAASAASGHSEPRLCHRADLPHLKPLSTSDFPWLPG